MGRTMRTPLRPLLDTLLVRKPSSSATLFETLKWGMGLEHSGHGSPLSDFLPILSCLAATPCLAQPKANMGTVVIADLS